MTGPSVPEDPGAEQEVLAVTKTVARTHLTSETETDQMCGK